MGDGLVKCCSMKHDHATKILCRLDLCEGCHHRQNNDRVYPVKRSRESDALCVIARRCTYDATLFLFVGEMRDLVICTPDLERSTHLQAFGLEMRLGADLT